MSNPAKQISIYRKMAVTFITLTLLLAAAVVIFLLSALKLLLFQ